MSNNNKKNCLGKTVKWTLIIFFFEFTIPYFILRWLFRRRKNHPIKSSGNLYKVLYGDNAKYAKDYPEDIIFSNAKDYVIVANNIVPACTEKMAKTHTPKVFFESAAEAETNLNGKIVIQKHYPRLVNNPKNELANFEKLRVKYFKAFADRFFEKVEKEFKQSQNRGRAELSRLAVYEKEMLPEERQYYTDKKSKL